MTFAIQFVDKSLGPILPLYIAELGVTPERVPIVSGILFSVLAATASVGHHLTGKLLKTHPPRTIIATVSGIAGVAILLFVWQPSPLYAYDLRAHAFADFDFGFNNYARFGYPMFAERLKASPADAAFVWAADIQQGLNEPLYVDQVHYTAAMNARLARFIGRALDERGVLRTALAGGGFR